MNLTPVASPPPLGGDGGSPLDADRVDRARLLLAGALLDTPPLLVLDHLDERAGVAAGRAAVTPGRNQR